jgi:hypothetical protein
LNYGLADQWGQAASLYENQPVGKGTAIMPHPLRGWQAPFLVGDALEVPPIPPAFCLPRLSREIDISLYKDNPAGAWQSLAEPKDICVDVRYPGKSLGGGQVISPNHQSDIGGNLSVLLIRNQQMHQLS